MRTVFLLIGVCASVFCFASSEQGQDELETRKYKVSDNQFLKKQKDVLRLFKYINQPSFYQDHIEIAKSYVIEANLDEYTNQQVIKDFFHYYKKGFLPKGEIFSVFYQPHLNQAVALFKILYYAKTFESFYKTAIWARHHLNEGLFLYAFSVALVHRHDTYGIVLPPIYEVNPYYFFNDEVMYKVHQYKEKVGRHNKLGQVNYIISANNSGYRLNLNEDQVLSYYTEDVGVNAYYYYYNLYYPFWMNGEEFHLKHERRGEQFYYIHQQLLARYYLERLSNDLGEIEHVNYDVPFKCGYYPSLRYANGLEFPTRPNYVHLYEYFYNYGQKFTLKAPYGYSYTFVRDYERRIRDAIDAGYVYTATGQRVEIYSQEGINILGNLIESNPDSPNTRYYGALIVFARHLLGYSYQPRNKYQIAPSALEHFETSLRDPAFYKLFKRIILLFQKFKFNLHSYTYNELAFPGVRIEGVNVDRLITYFDKFDSDLTNALYVDQQDYEDGNFDVHARQYRLNHKPFNYKINVTADQPAEAVVRVYLGPKHDEYGRQLDINENRFNFVEIDHFVVSLTPGTNTIKRNSRQSSRYATDRSTFHDLYSRVTDALNGDGEFQLDGSEVYYGYPQRYVLPKGKRNGQHFQMYVIINPYRASAQTQQKDEKVNHYYPRVGTGGQYIDNYPLGYPFDRAIDEFNFFVPNSYFQDVVIYHKEIDDVSTVRQQIDYV